MVWFRACACGKYFIRLYLYGKNEEKMSNKSQIKHYAFNVYSRCVEDERK